MQCDNFKPLHIFVKDIASLAIVSKQLCWEYVDYQWKWNFTAWSPWNSTREGVGWVNNFLY